MKPGNETRYRILVPRPQPPTFGVEPGNEMLIPRPQSSLNPSFGVESVNKTTACISDKKSLVAKEVDIINYKLTALPVRGALLTKLLIPGK